MHKNCCHQSCSFWLRYAPNRLSARASPQTPLVELIALPQTPSWFRGWGPQGKGRREERGEGRGGNPGMPKSRVGKPSSNCDLCTEVDSELTVWRDDHDELTAVSHSELHHIICIGQLMISDVMGIQGKKWIGEVVQLRFSISGSWTDGASTCFVLFLPTFSAHGYIVNHH